MKLTSSTIATLLIAFTVNAQTQLIQTDTLIVYDFLKPDVPKNVRISHGKTIQFKIRNINRTLYNYNFSQQVSNFNTSIPPIFNSFTSATLPASGTNEALGAAADTSGFQKAYTAFKGRARAMTEISILQNNLQYLLQNCSDSFVVIRQSAYRIVAAYEGTGITSLPEAISKTRIKINQQLENIHADYSLLLVEYEKIKTKTTEQKAIADQLTGQLSKAKDPEKAKLITDLAKQNKIVSEANMAFSDAKAKFDEATKLNDEVDKFITSKGIEAVLTTIENFNESNFAVYSPVYTASGDEIIVNFAIDPKGNLPCQAPYATFKRDVTIKVKGGLKLDFSSGLFLNFAFNRNNFFDQSYRLDSVAGHPDQKKIVRNHNRNMAIPSIGALLHIYRRSGTSFNWGGAFGASISNEARANYHGGVSMIFGRDQRVVLSSGLTYCKATLLSSRYEENQVIPLEPLIDPVPTEDFYRLGWFFCFSYNITAR